MSRIKEIWCMPHSHLDIGYTHPQPMLLELQVDYLEQALELCDRTRDYPEGARFCWTVEANYILKKWLQTAGPDKVDRLKQAIKRGQVCVTALPFHTTPCANANEMVRMLSDLDTLRRTLDCEVNIAINHDVNGQPWTLGQVLLDSGIDFYLTGINIHFGGIPMPRPAAFLWEMSDGRKLQSYVGEHYSLFSQFLYTQEHSTARMHEGALEYADWLEKKGYDRDFAFLTATNPPLYDNNCPDAQLSDLIRQYNEEGHEFKLRLVTAQALRERVLSEEREKMPVHRGDWTDYWNFGAGSTARETRVSRLAKYALQQSEVIDCFTMKRGAHHHSVLEQCYDSALVYEEHTWGASQSVTQPDSPETYSQLVHKIKKAYEAADLAGYLLGSSLETLAGNPHQSNGLFGITVTNTSPFPQTVELTVPGSFLEPVRQLAALRIKGCAPYLEPWEETRSLGLVTIPPFTEQVLPFASLTGRQEEKGAIAVEPGSILTPYYRISLDPDTGAVRQVTDRKTGRELLEESRGYGLFEPIRETVDSEKNPACRATLFPRDVDLGNHSITQWNHGWKAKREKAQRLGRPEIILDGCKVTLVSELLLAGMGRMEQKITFYAYQSKIRMSVSFRKEAVYEPESLYFAVPLRMNGGWECSYDTAGLFVKLDEEQLGTVCRDWITVDTGVSVYDGESCVTLACPDAPLVQVGGFGFGRESRAISREENPLLLAWALNNYWDTNFCANQSGKMTFAYELNRHDHFRPEEALADGISAQNPVVIGACVEGKEGRRTMLRTAGRSIVLHISPEDDLKAVRALVVNPSEDEDRMTLELPGRTISGAAVVSPSGKELEPGTVRDGTASVRVPAKGVRVVRLKL